MIANLLAPITHNDNALNGISRSRFSFRFNTARRRRWFIVQVVTAPIDTQADDAGGQTSSFRYKPETISYAGLLENFHSTRISPR